MATNQTEAIERYGFEVFINQAVDYNQIKEEFQAKLLVAFPEADDVKIGIWLNMSALVQKVAYKVQVAQGENITLSHFTRLMEIANTKEKTLERNKLSVTRIARAYADETREFLGHNGALAKIPLLGDLGFPNSYMCSNLTHENYAEIYRLVKAWEETWETAKQTTRFSDNVMNYCIKIKRVPAHFFNI